MKYILRVNRPTLLVINNFHIFSSLSGFTTFMTWQAITEEESVPVVKAGDTMVSIYFMFEIVCTLCL